MSMHLNIQFNVFVKEKKFIGIVSNVKYVKQWLQLKKENKDDVIIKLKKLLALL